MHATVAQLPNSQAALSPQQQPFQQLLALQVTLVLVLLLEQYHAQHAAQVA
jgi:hypothetical protein